MAMEQDERAVAGLREGEEEQEAVLVSRARNAGGHGAAGSDSDEGEDIEEALTEESEGVAPAGNASHGDASGCARNEEHEAPEENPSINHFERRGFRPARWAIARAMPPSSHRLLPLRSRKGANPTRWIIVEDAASACANTTHDDDTTEVTSGPPSSASFMSASATSRSASLSVMGGAVHGARNKALGSTARRAESGAAVDKPSPGDQKSGTDAAAATEASSSRRLPSRSRKRRRPDHFISYSEEAASAARAKAHRSDTALDRFLTSQLRASPPEWPRNVAADGAGAEGRRGGDVSMTTASWGGPEDPDGSARVLAVVAILGASLALSVVSCVLFYIVGQQAASGPCDSCQKK